MDVIVADKIDKLGERVEYYGGGIKSVQRGEQTIQGPGATNSQSSIATNIPIAPVDPEKTVILYEITNMPQAGSVVEAREGSVSLESDKIVVTLNKSSALSDFVTARFVWQLIEGK